MNTKDFNQWAEKLVEAHKKPLKKLEITRSKLFLPSGAAHEDELVQKSLAAVEDVLRTERVERRCARSVANWLPHQKLAEVTKISGVMNNYGFANKNGKFLYPEEAMFLLETNRLELLWNQVPLSIQQAYEIILNESVCSLARYVTYRKLALDGFRLTRADRVQSQDDLSEPTPKKRLCVEPEVKNNESTLLEETKKPQSETNKMIDEIFNKLQSNGPKKYVPQVKDNCDYKIFLPESGSRTSVDFNLQICENKYIEPSMCLVAESHPTIIGYTNSQFVGYLRMAPVDLPSLP